MSIKFEQGLTLLLKRLKIQTFADQRHHQGYGLFQALTTQIVGKTRKWKARERLAGREKGILSPVSSRFLFVFALSQFRGPDYLGAWEKPEGIRKVRFRVELLGNLRISRFLLAAMNLAPTQAFCFLTPLYSISEKERLINEGKQEIMTLLYAGTYPILAKGHKISCFWSSQNRTKLLIEQKHSKKKFVSLC